MPIVQITLLQGREPELVKTCIKEVARTINRTLGAPLDTIRVLVNQLPPEQWGIGERTRDEIDAEKAALAARRQDS